jgi:hypothetical protein
MRSTSNSDPVSYWVAITVASSATSVAAGEYVATLTVPRTIPNRGTDASGNHQFTSLPIRGVYCKTAGNAVLQYTQEDGTTVDTVDFTGLVAGAVYPFCPSRQMGGNATLIALYG